MPQTKVEKKLEILRVAGAIANYRLITNLNRAAVEVQPGDSLTGDDLRQFVVQMIGDDLEPDQISVVETVEVVRYVAVTLTRRRQYLSKQPP